MFDLNELPENEGPTGRSFASLLSLAAAGERRGRGAAATAKERDEDDDVVLNVEGVVDDEDAESELESESYYVSRTPNKIVCRLLQDDEAAVKEPRQRFLGSKSAPAICYSSEWQPLEVSTFSEHGIDIDNEVTVAALDARAILDGECVTGLDSAVSLVVPAKPTVSVGISPRPGKLGQRTETSRKYSNYTNFHRSQSKWEGIVLEKRSSERFEHGQNLNTRPSLLYPALISSRKGKRAREEGSYATVDTVLKLKRHVRPTASVVVADSYDGAGPSLSMSLDQDAPTIETAQRQGIIRKKEGSERGEISLFIGESSPGGSQSPLVVERVPKRRPLGLKSNLGLSLMTGQTLDRVESNLDTVTVVCKGREGHESVLGMKRVERDVPDGASRISGKPVWQGKFLIQGYSATDVAAYCSVDLQPASKLWSLPQVVRIENVVKIQEFFAAAKLANVVEPVLQLRLLPEAVTCGPSFADTVAILESDLRGRVKDRSCIPGMPGWQSGTHFSRTEPFGAVRSDYVFLASPKLKQPKDACKRVSAKLYLVLGSSLDLISTVGTELENKLFEGVDWSSPPEKNYLFGFLCVCDDEGRFDDFSCNGDVQAKAFPTGVDVSSIKKPVVLPELPSNRAEEVVVCALLSERTESSDAGPAIIRHKIGDAVAIVENDEETIVTDDPHPSELEDQNGNVLNSSHEAKCLDKAKVREENSSFRHNQSRMPDDSRKARDKQRDGDRDAREREKEKDLKNSNKDVHNKDIHRHIHRSNEKTNLFKRDCPGDGEGNRIRERYRDSHCDLTDKSKSSRETVKELEKHRERQRDKDRAKEKERLLRKQYRSAEPGGVTVDDSCDSETEKALMTAEQATHYNLLHLSAKENKKRNRVGCKEPENNPALSIVSTAYLENEGRKFAEGARDAMTEPVRRVLLLDSTEAHGLDGSESRVQVTDSATVESVGYAVTCISEGKAINMEVAVHIDHKDQNKKANEIAIEGQEQSSAALFATHAPAQHESNRSPRSKIIVRDVGPGNSVTTETCDAAGVVYRSANIVKETQDVTLLDGGEARVVKDIFKDGPVQPGKHAMDGLSHDIITDGETVESGCRNINDGDVDVRGGTGSTSGIRPPVQESSYNPSQERKIDAEVLDDVHRPNTRNLSLRGDDSYSSVEERRSDDKEVSQDVRLPPGRFKTVLSTQKSISGVDDQHHGSFVGVESLSVTDNALVGSSPRSSADVTSEILLEGCDKETRSWLVSRQNVFYLSEEFGVRIAKMEEIVNSKSNTHLKTQQGPVDVKIMLVTENSTDTNEEKWFINQAAGVLQVLASRGVFTKCLWYQGQAQRYGSEEAPSIPVIVKRIKGEDGKNLEKIQEETGVMIGIVLDANNKKGIGNSTHVIGLRLKGTRKKGIQQATERVKLLLSQVAKQLLKGPQGTVTCSQDTTLLKLKVDFSNNTSPSSGIPTPVQKDVLAANSPVSPVPTISFLRSFRYQLDEPSIEAKNNSSATTPLSLHSDCALDGNPAPATVGHCGSQVQQAEVEQPGNGHRLPDFGIKCSRPLLVSNLPEGSSASMLRELFVDVLTEKFGTPSTYEGMSDMILDIRFSPDKVFAFVEFATDELPLEVLKVYADDKPAFLGLNLELGSPASLTTLDRTFLSARAEAISKGLEYGGDIMNSLKLARSRVGRKGHKSDDHLLRVATLHSSPESDIEVSQDRRFGGREGGVRYLAVGEKPSPLFLTELMRNASARSIHNLFEDIIKKYISSSLGNFKERVTVLDVRFIPSRGCAFVDLATAELVEFMLGLHSRRPEVFHHMKMEIGRRPVPLGHGEEELVVRRSSHPARNTLVEESHRYGSEERSRGYFYSTSPPGITELAVMDHDFGDDYEDEEDERQPISLRKRRSDPERTVYADRLPDNASDGMIRRIFELVLRENMTEEQREMLGDHIITEVRYVPTKYCAFIVFVAEELTRLVLQLYNQDEEIFKSMRLKPHFHSKMEDLYREDLHDREDGLVHRVLSREMTMDRRSRRGIKDYQNDYSNAEIADIIHCSRNVTAHRAVAAIAFKEVDRRRSVYVDRIPERLSEPTMRKLFERALRHYRQTYKCRHVSQVTFFWDKFDPEKLCAFVELENEGLVQELLNIYIEDEEAFSGMRVRPAVKYGH